MTDRCSCLPCEINNAIDRFCARYPRVSGEHIIASIAEVIAGLTIDANCICIVRGNRCTMK
jgi:hypothetical protein